MIRSVEESVREVGPWGCGGDPIRALLKADGHSDLDSQTKCQLVMTVQ